MQVMSRRYFLIAISRLQWDGPVGVRLSGARCTNTIACTTEATADAVITFESKVSYEVVQRAMGKIYIYIYKIKRKHPEVLHARGRLTLGMLFIALLLSLPAGHAARLRSMAERPLLFGAILARETLWLLGRILGRRRRRLHGHRPIRGCASRLPRQCYGGGGAASLMSVLLLEGFCKAGVGGVLVLQKLGTVGLRVITVLAARGVEVGRDHVGPLQDGCIARRNWISPHVRFERGCRPWGTVDLRNLLPDHVHVPIWWP